MEWLLDPGVARRDASILAGSLLVVRLSDKDVMRLVFDHIAEPMFVHDAAGRILDANRAACAQVGYERAELVGMHVSDIEIVGSKGIFAAWDRVARGERVAAETMQKRKDGSLVPVRVTISRLTEEPLMFLAVAVPTSERA